MKRIGIVATLISTGLVLAACGSTGNSHAKAGSTLTIAELAELTGVGATAYGIPVHNGIDLAIRDVNRSDLFAKAGVSLKVETTDDGSDPVKAATAFSKAVSKKPVAVVESALTSVYAALLPLANNSKTVLFSAASGGPGSDDNDFAFRTNDAISPMVTLGKYLATTKKLRRVAAIVATDSPVFQGLEKNFLKEFTDAGQPIPFVSSEGVTSSQTDFASILTKLRGKGLDGIFLDVLPAQAGTILTQMESLGGFENVQCIGQTSFTVDVAKIGGPLAQKCIFAAPWAQGSLTAAASEKNFVDEYTARYHVDPSSQAVLGYQTGWLLAVAIKRILDDNSTVTPERLKAALPAVSEDAEFKSHSLIPDFNLLDSGAASFAGTLATFSPEGKIIALKSGS